MAHKTLTYREEKGVAPEQRSPRVMASISDGYACEGGTRRVVPVSTIPRLLPPPPRRCCARWWPSPGEGGDWLDRMNAMQ